MEWSYLYKLFKDILYNTNNILLSVPAYISVTLSLFAFFWPKKEGKINWLIQIIQEHPALIIMSFLMVSVILVSHSLYKNKQPNFASPDELTQSVLRNRDIRLSDLTREDFRIRNKVFLNCHIYGPAIIYPTKQTVLANLRFVDVTAEGGLIVTTNKQISGAVAFEGCTLQGCTFHKISFIGSEARIAEIKAHSNLAK